MVPWCLWLRSTGCSVGTDRRWLTEAGAGPWLLQELAERCQLVPGARELGSETLELQFQPGRFGTIVACLHVGRGADQQAGHDARQGTDDPDARHHDERGCEASRQRGRIAIAIADRCDRYHRPPECVAARQDVRGC